MGNTLAADTIPVLVTLVDVHNMKAQDMFYFCNVSSGGASTKVIGRSQTLSVEVGITTILSMTVYECPEPVFTPETARVVGILRIPIERLAERYSSGIFQQWFNLDTTADPRTPAGDPQQVVNKFEDAYTQSVVDIAKPKICISVIGSAFEVQRGSRSAFSIFVGEDVKTQAGPDLKALIASHKQQAAYIDGLYEELRKKNVPSYRPVAHASKMGVPMPTEKLTPVQPPPVYASISAPQPVEKISPVALAPVTVQAPIQTMHPYASVNYMESPTVSKSMQAPQATMYSSFQQSAPVPSSMKAPNAFDAFDTNNDGVITREEFVNSFVAAKRNEASQSMVEPPFQEGVAVPPPMSFNNSMPVGVYTPPTPSRVPGYTPVASTMMPVGY